MIVDDLEVIEKEYYAEHNFMVIPQLISSYFENKEFELVYFYSKEYLLEFGQCEFYYMMSMMELGYYDRAGNIYRKYKGDWFQRCKQQGIYWKHVVVFALYFKELDVTEFYANLFDDYYEQELVQLLEYLAENKDAAIYKSDIFKRVSGEYPILKTVYSDNEHSKKREILSFENIQWKVWNKANSFINNGDKLGIEKVYECDWYEIYSYSPKQVSASMHIIRDKNTVILLDCGCEIFGDESKRIPVKKILEELDIEHIDAVFISHAHMDHYGSLNEIRNNNTYMTKTTYQLIKCVSPEVYLGKTRVVNPYDIVDIDGVQVRFVPNGHIAGSVLFDINWKSCNRIVYTGDFSIEDQRTVKGLVLDDILHYDKKRIDVLLTETTYGKKTDMLSQKQYEKIFISLCYKHSRYGNKIFIPCFAVGRAQEVALLLTDMADRYGLRILIDGMATKVTDFYQTVIGNNQKIIGKNVSTCHNELDYKERITNYDIILASSGMLKEGSTSAKYAVQLMDEKGLCIIKVGFIHETEHLLQSIVSRKNSNLHFVDLSLSAHVGYKELVNTIDQMSPNNVIYVHGEGIAKL